MGAVQTADGQIVWVPDDTFGAPAPPQELAPAGIAMPQDQPQAFNGGGLPPEVSQGLGFNAPTVQPPPMTPAPQPDPTPIQIPASSEVTAKQSTAADKALAAQHAQLDAQDKANRAAEAQQAAYEATPEGKIETATRREETAAASQQVVNEAKGNLEAQQANEQYAIQVQAEADKQRIAQEGAAREAAAAKSLADERMKAQKSVEAEANYKIDDNRRWHQMSTGKKVLAGIAVILSGLGDALQRKSGPNMAFAMIMDAIHEDVAAQVRDRAELGKKAGLAKDSLDRHIAEAGSIPAATDRMIAQRIIQANNDLKLSAAKYAGPAQKLATQQVSAALDIEAAKRLEDSAVKSSGIIQQRENQRLERERVSQGWAGQAQAERHFQSGQELEREKFAATQIADQKKLDAQLAETAEKRGLEAAKQERELAMPGVYVAGSDGKEKTFIASAGRPEDVAAQKLVVAGVRKYVSMLDRANEIGVKWASNTANSNELQELKTLQGNMDLNAQQLFKLGVLQEKDLKLTHQASGAEDLTQWKDSQAGRDEARRLAIKNLDIELHSSFGMGSKDHFDIKEYKAPPKTAEEKHIDKLLSAPDSSFSRRQRGPLIVDQKISPEQIRLIKNQGALASGNGKSAEDAMRILRHIADNAENQEMRDAAMAQIQDSSVNRDLSTSSPEQVR